jgi:hypothetical protein
MSTRERLVMVGNGCGVADRPLATVGRRPTWHRWRADAPVFRRELTSLGSPKHPTQVFGFAAKLGIPSANEEADMSRVVADEEVRGGRMRIPRSRGAASGLLVVLLGLWGALVPFVGPQFDFAYNPDVGSSWSAARGWLEVLPGAVAVVGGFLLLTSRNRATAMLGGWLSVIAGAWFVVGRVVATTLTIGEIGPPVAETDTKAAWLELTYFYGLGALIVFLGAMGLGRLSVRSVRDVGYAQRVATADRVEHLDAGDQSTTVFPATGPTPTNQTYAGNVPRRSWRDRFKRRGQKDTLVER